MEKHSFEEHRQSLAGKFEKRRTLYTIYFSPTGGTKKVADIVSRALSNEGRRRRKSKRRRSS